MANLQANLRSQCAIALDHPERLLRSVNQVFMGTPPTVLTLLSSLPNTTTACRACVTRIVDICPAFSCGATARLSGWIQRVCRWDSSANGIARSGNASSSHTLALYTDGATESFNDAGEEFGEQRLIEVLRRNSEFPRKALMASIVDEVRRFSPHEQRADITLIIAKCRGHR
jgi:hypothetical protein